MNTFSKTNKTFSIVQRAIKHTRARNCAFIVIDKERLNKSEKHLEEVLQNL
jgi:hypothetical protein